MELQVINADQQLQIQKLGAQTNIALNVQGCPQGWVRFQSSCYQGSSHENTWDFAKQDCESEGAHLVITNGQLEERVIKAIGGTVWFGLSRQPDRDFYSWTWRWVDGSLCNIALQIPYGFTWSPSCVYYSHINNCLIPTNCRELRHWMCEMEL
ncbi:killer cell lectin-like receptor subfamily B member 1B allele C [Parambassis ranga]|uniref:Killer cell lectin-like receptor subfamily B member 1B allele C n=1 Tax=Parambassis ranga TaxID=210632 RepID=A0A6P7K314_9TELE|nr:killer cell lectin-like receptor subfamily B member 1B allele C [Parambassis ranga]